MSSTEIRGKVATGYGNVARHGADGGVADLRCTRDGILFTADWMLAQAMEGRMFCANAGSITTPLTWTATADNDMTKAAVFVSVPSGTTIIPVSVSLYMEAFGSTAQFECAGYVGSGGVSAGGTAVTITNMRSDAPATSLCTVTSDLTGGTALTTNIVEFWRDGQQFTVTKTAGSATASVYDPCKFVWRLSDTESFPIVVGAGQLVITQGSQAGTGFCKVVWIEIPSTMVS